MESFVQRHRNSLIISALAVGLTGLAAYYATRPELPDPAPTDKEPEAKKPKQVKKKKPTPVSHGFNTERLPGKDAPYYPIIDDMAKISKKSDKERKEIADELKAAGNYAFTKSSDNTKALELYSQAIRIHSKGAIYYSNRAAVYAQLGEYEKVIEDTTKALELQPDYTKSFSRRGAAQEKIGNYSESVMDFTAVCILSNFEDEAAGKAVDRVLKLQAERLVDEKFGSGKAKYEFPSPSFISAYLHSFHARALPESVENAEEGTGEWELKLAFDAISKENAESYKQAIEHLAKALNKGLKNKENEALALEYQATFKFVLNDNEDAMKDINKAIELKPTASALIKRSSLHVEVGNLEAANADFMQADQLEPNNADYYYQLAQLSFLQQDWNGAVGHYNKSLEIDDSFLLAHIQLAVTKYRMGQSEVAKRKFEKLVEKYPEDSNVYNYYGEILLDLKDVDAAHKAFDKAIELESAKATAAMNVLPLINKSLAIVGSGTSKEEIEKAAALCRKAIAIDPASDVAIGTLAQFCLQQGETKEAIELFERSADLARTRPERVQALTFAVAARTQTRLAIERPVVRERLEMQSHFR